MSQKKETKKQLAKYSALEAVKNSEGGQQIIRDFEKNIMGCIDELATKYKTSTHIELIALIARMTERITILRLLNRSTNNKNLTVEELKQILKDDPEEKEEE